MADPTGRLIRVGDWGLDIPVPNPGLQEWLNSEQARVALTEIAQEIYRAYVNYLPASRAKSNIPGSGMRNLKKGAFSGVGRRNYPGQTERYYAWVGNRALSYKATKGKPYPRFIEYGKANADGSRTGGGYQLRNAMLSVANRRGVGEAAMAYLGGGSHYNPAMHQARPAIPKSEIEKMRELAKGDRGIAERAAATRRRQEAAKRNAARSRANINRAVQRANLEKSLKPKPPPKQK